MKVVVIGAGSASFGRGVIADLFQEEAQGLPDLEICLVDTAPEALATMLAFAERLKAHTASRARLTSFTDRRQALPGADYVITAVSVRRMALWEQDFRVPHAHGVEHILGENGGPGALFHALRSFNLMLPICRDVEELCPQALLLNFTNPESRVLHAILHLTKVRAVGLCHGVFGLELLASRLTGLPLEDLEVTSAGLNHVFCALSIKEKCTGRELLPEVLRRVQEDETVSVPPLYREMARIYDVLSYPSDDHIGEYFSFGTDFHGRKWQYGLENKQVAAAEAESPDLVGGFLCGEVPVEQALQPSGEVAVPVICALQQAEPVRVSAVNLLNTGSLITNLPEHAVVEVPATVNSAGVKPLAVGTLPEGWAAHLRTQCAIIATLTEAYRTRSKKLLLQALLLDPCMHSVRGARALLDDMLDLQAEYLPQFE
ncbi:MAG TPA: alpha-glucosidase/alpha-galactosidase [Armatimonadota bacterium]|jgi:alpha-galactosidase